MSRIILALVVSFVLSFVPFVQVPEVEAAVSISGGSNSMGAQPALTWYFAEGYTAPGFDEYLVILNSNDRDAEVTITYYLGRGDPVTKFIRVPAARRYTVVVHDEGYHGVGRVGEVSAKVQSDQPVVVERPMYFIYNGSAGQIKGGHTVLGASSPHTTWYFAEGYTGTGFDEYLTIQNPNPAEAEVKITYFLGRGGPVVKNLRIPGASRYTVVVHDPKEGVGRNQEVSALVESTNGVGIVVERPMYFRYSGSSFTATDGHNVMGVNASGTSWLFAEGYTGTGFDEYLTIMNPDPADAEVKVTYYLGNGAPVEKTLTIRANSRYTVQVHNSKEGVGRGQEVSSKVESTNGVGIVVERPMYFRYSSSINGGHNVMGATELRDKWFFADGSTKQGVHMYLTVMNPNDSDASVAITYYPPTTGGARFSRSIMAKASSRTTISVHDPSRPGGAIAGASLGVQLSVSADAPILVERPMYFDLSGGLTPPGQMLFIPKSWPWTRPVTITLVFPREGSWFVILTTPCKLNLSSGFVVRGNKATLRNQWSGQTRPGDRCPITAIVTLHEGDSNAAVFTETQVTTIVP